MLRTALPVCFKNHKDMRPSTTCWEIHGPHRNAGATAAALLGGFTAKTQREARLNPSETDLPRLLQSVCDASVFSASSANLAKIAHRGRNGTSCPAMTTLRLCRGLRCPCTPRKRRALYPNRENERASQVFRMFRVFRRFRELKHPGSAAAKPRTYLFIYLYFIYLGL